MQIDGQKSDLTGADPVQLETTFVFYRGAFGASAACSLHTSAMHVLAMGLADLYCHGHCARPLLIGHYYVSEG